MKGGFHCTDRYLQFEYQDCSNLYVKKKWALPENAKRIYLEKMCFYYVKHRYFENL